MNHKKPLPDTGDDKLAIIQALKTMDTAKKEKILGKIELLKASTDNSTDNNVISPSIINQKES